MDFVRYITTGGLNFKRKHIIAAFILRPSIRPSSSCRSFCFLACPCQCPHSRPPIYTIYESQQVNHRHVIVQRNKKREACLIRGLLVVNVVVVVIIKVVYFVFIVLSFCISSTGTRRY
ncbi:uncharacterized protein BO96DRAFT_234483 [Aspergillus niger CBS 101883]|uniref:uncharacterized protein n=1 Tax=Aspergillus lacticoffeatus (strain CBS 101883) TaxID=1450533 RepID=UPI000D7F7857|nr:uncharacterized protein BO96DRAFT_234483 [Aspergillus niger CBS 101883]PYH59149.1 hypothetical protein BO96DRAFT_234483 [Aspergillus niger CBS 101883]